jgi:hypothetical protein
MSDVENQLLMHITHPLHSLHHEYYARQKSGRTDFDLQLRMADVEQVNDI